MIPGVLIAVLAGVSVVLVLIGLPMALGKIPPNDWYGVRLPVTMRSRAAWDAANVQYGWWAVLAGVVSLPILFCGWYFGSSTFLIVLYMVVMLGPLLGGIAPCVLAAYRAEAREQTGEDVASKQDAGAQPDEHDEIPGHLRR